MKKVISVLLVFCMALGVFAGAAAAAPEYTGHIKDALSVLLIDENSGRVLFEQKADDQVKPASTTKMLTAIIALENSSMDDVVTVGSEGDWSSKAGMGYSLLGIKKNEQIKMKDLLYGMMLVSGDDAACAIAVYIGGKVDAANPMDAFISMMNAKAQEIGMTSSNFTNPGGVEDEQLYVTARDMAKLAVYAMKNQDFRDMVKTFSYDMPATNKHDAQTAENTNFLLDPESEYYYANATGIKTGRTSDAGGTLVASATKDGMNLICLIFNDKTTDRTDRWPVAKGLFEWGFENYKTLDVASLLENTSPVQAQVENYAADDVSSGMLEFAKPEQGAAYITLEKAAAEALQSGTDSFVITPTYSSELQAPVMQGDILGTVTYSSQTTGEVIYSGNLIASRDVLKAEAPATPEPAVSPTEAPPTPSPTKERSDTGSGSLLLWIVIAAGVILIAVAVYVAIRVRNIRKANQARRRRARYNYRVK